MPEAAKANSTPYDRSLLRTVHLVPLTAYDAAGRLALDVQSRHEWLR